jgi:predicted AAA+ superfamily ATPase
MLIDSIWDWNPWWDDPGSINVLSGKPRVETDLLIRTLQDRKVTILSGIRRSGKTTIMYQLIEHLLKDNNPKNILFLGLEDPAFLNVDLFDILSEYRKEMNPDGRSFIFLDEVQTKEGWERIIRRENDIYNNQKIIATGSSSRLLSGNYSTLLTGRNLTVQIHPISFRDFPGFINESKSTFSGIKGKEKLDSLMRKYLTVGGFPEVILQPEEFRKATLNQYFHDIIHRDIVDQYSVDPRKIQSLAGFLMLNIGKMVTLSSLRRSVGLSFDAIRDYLQYLRRSGLFYLMPEFSFSKKPMIKESGKHKVYSADLGMARYVHGRHSSDLGRFAENAVYLDLIHRGFDPGFIHNRKEIDFVVPISKMIQVINVSYGEAIPEREYEGLQEFISSNQKLKTRPLLISKNIGGTMNGVEHIPLSQWLFRDK